MTSRRYDVPVDQTRWQVASGNTTVFDWNYDGGRERLLGLYERGKQRQWDAAERLDWSMPVDLDNPMGTPDPSLPIHGSPVWDALGPEDRGLVRRHVCAWQFSQFLHGEQGALICSAKIVQTVPDADSKFYAATQVVDEARHMEAYSRYLREKLDLSYPINPGLRALLDDVISDARWDMTYLGMQVLIEGLALAAFGLIRDSATEPLAQAVNAYVMQDEARHVAFGRLALRDYYPQLTTAERREREEFCAEACHLMHDRFVGEEIWQTLDLNPAECVAFVRSSAQFRAFQSHLFSRIVPTLRDIGLFGDTVQRAFGELGVLGYQNISIDHLMSADEAAAQEIDQSRRQQVANTIALGDDTP